MLEHLLELIAGGRIQSLDEIARKMEVPTTLVSAMLGDLERMGYLKKINATCEKTCSGCPSQGMCGIIGGGGLWSVTDKGMEAAGRYAAG